MSGTAGRGGVRDPAVEETMRLYHAWLGYLLNRLGRETVRVSAGDIREALDELSVSVSRDGEMYVITLIRGGSRNCDTGSQPESRDNDTNPGQRHQTEGTSPPQAKEVDRPHGG